MAKKPTETAAEVPVTEDVPVVAEAPKPFAVFRYLPYARINSTFPSGTPVVLQFDGDGLFNCADNQWYSAVCRAVVDPDIAPGHISQVTQ